jgi:Na+-transporting NADH:ubiquinone oxidoreductase subunit NqrB
MTNDLAASALRPAHPSPLTLDDLRRAGPPAAPGRVRRLVGSFLALDPRLYQIAVLGSLLLYGVLALHLEVQPLNAAVIVATALLVQGLMARMTGRPHLDLRSALISALSLCLLLRTNAVELAALAALIAVGSKFVLRVRGKHVFNPTNLAIVALLLLSRDVWVSPGQWGSATVLAFALAAAGSLVVHRAARADVTFTFLLVYAAAVLGRAAWLGDPWAIPFLRLQNGALVLFAFYMISDPRTTPDRRAGRVLFGALVALLAAAIQFRLFRSTGPLWALALLSPLTPLLDRLLPGPRFTWPGQRSTS